MKEWKLEFLNFLNVFQKYEKQVKDIKQKELVQELIPILLQYQH